MKERRSERKRGDIMNVFVEEGDNLITLDNIENESIQIVYTDPPYNTGKKNFFYEDSIDDWEGFMESRLKKTRCKLAAEGIIFIHIGKDQFAELKLIMDRVFGKQNFIENIIWIKNTKKNDTRFISSNHEYILVYAKNLEYIKNKTNRSFSKVKKGFQEVMDERNRFLKEQENNPALTVAVLEERIKNLYKSNPDWKGITSYKHVEENTFRIYSRSNMAAPGGRGCDFDVLHPMTGLPVKKPPATWRFSEKTMNDLINAGKISFGKDHTTIPRYKGYLDEVERETLPSIIEDSTNGYTDLENDIGQSPNFNNPKPVRLVKYLLSSYIEIGDKVLDIFAGSGTTAIALSEFKIPNLECYLLCKNEVAAQRRRVAAKNGENVSEQLGIFYEVLLPRLHCRFANGQIHIKEKGHP